MDREGHYWWSKSMSVAVELIPDPEEGGFTARLPDIPAYGEGETAEEAIADLREAIRGYIQAFGLEDAVARLSTPEVRHVEWNLAELARDPDAASSKTLA